MVYFDEICKLEACGQTVLPERSLLIGQKLLENAKIENTQMRHFLAFSNTVDLVGLKTTQNTYREVI